MSNCIVTLILTVKAGDIFIVVIEIRLIGIKQDHSSRHNYDPAC